MQPVARLLKPDPRTKPEPIFGGRPLATLVPVGRVIELCGVVARGRLTMAVQGVIAAQSRGEVCAWVQHEGAGLYPPDLARAGVDLDELLVLQTPASAGCAAVAKGAELLLRSGGFGLVVLDLINGVPRGESWAVRIGGLARHHRARVLLLTASAAVDGSVGATVAVRAEPKRSRAGKGYVLDAALLRDRCDLTGRVTRCAHGPPWGS